VRTTRRGWADEVTTITPVSAAEFRAQSEGRIPEAAQVADDVWCVPLEIAPGHMPFSLAYLVRDAAGDVHIIDPGYDVDANFHAVVETLRDIAGERARLASIVVTHLHPDHIGLAERLRAETGASICLHAVEQWALEAVVARASDPAGIRAGLAAWGVPEDRHEELVHAAVRAPFTAVRADVLVEDGAFLPIPGRRLRVRHTPGHTAGHICVVDDDEGLIYTGDHVLPTVTPGVGLAGPDGANPIDRYLSGLVDMRAFDDFVALPGHGYRFRGIAARAGQIARRHLGRTSEVARALEEEPDASVWEVASRLSWSRGWENLPPPHLTSALRQTEMHVRLVGDGRHEEMRTVWGEDEPHPRPSE